MKTYARRALFAAALALIATSCRDPERFSTRGDHYEGLVIGGSFTRAGVEDSLRLCLDLDASALQERPGALRSSDGRFNARLRPVPEAFHDPLSTLTFGDGREQTYLYGLTPTSDGGVEPEVMAFVSLMTGGAVEVRLVRGAAGAEGASEPGQAARIFAVFPLERRDGPCPF